METLCLNCSGISKGKFCSSSCAASFNNRNRSKAIYDRQRETLKRTIKCVGLKAPKIVSERAKALYEENPRLCIVCSAVIEQKFRRNKTCSAECKGHLLSKIKRDNPSRKLKKGTIEYKGILLDSSYELAVAKDLDANSIEWIRPAPLKYVDDEGLDHFYFPDFYLPAYDVYLDPKNDFLIATASRKIDLCSEQNKVQIAVLTKNDLSWDRIQMVLRPGFEPG